MFSLDMLGQLKNRNSLTALVQISAVSVSPQRARVGLYMHVPPENITGVEVVLFLRPLLRHLRGPVELLWDGGSIHKRDDVKAFLSRHPKLTVHRFPAYAPAQSRRVRLDQDEE